MKIFIDIGHPAHVHYFRHFVRIMHTKGHEVFITARDKEVTLSLLDHYKLEYSNRGKGRKSMLGKLVYILSADFFLLRKALKVKPDLFVSFGSPYAAHTAWLVGKPHLAFDDTDHNFFAQLMYVPFTETILTPGVYTKSYGKKHVRFNGFMELCSLHPRRFQAPDTTNVTRATAVIEKGSTAGDLSGPMKRKYIILRFVSWEASHDIGLSGLSRETKYALVRELSKYADIVISSESPLPPDLQAYGYSIHPAEMHGFMADAALLVSESLTMSAEAAFLGTPTLCISTARAGTLDEEVRLGLIELFRGSEGVVERAVALAKNPGYKSEFQVKSTDVVSTLIDVTGFMVWFVENYPASKQDVQNDPGYQSRFRGGYADSDFV